MNQDQAIQNALAALKDRRPREARRWAEKAVTLAPGSEEGWLVLAATASPRASLYYLQRALEINPASQRARRGMEWAHVRLSPSIRQSPASDSMLEYTQPRKLGQAVEANGTAIATEISRQTAYTPTVEQTQPRRLRHPASPGARIRPISGWLTITKPTLIVLLILIGGLITTWGTIQLVNGFFHSGIFPPARYAIAQMIGSPTPTDTALAPLVSLVAEAATPTARPPSTEPPVLLLTPTEMPTSTTEQTLPPTASLTPIPLPSKALPAGVSEGEFWVDVDLSAQRVDAYLGSQLLASFIVSTGLKPTPTVTGTFRIYVKYRYAHMSGPGYSLENVPYVMYFYKDYGLHGTYWHNNFGSPMSYGCVNFRTEDAAWVYKRAKIGTIVNVHRLTKVTH